MFVNYIVTLKLTNDNDNDYQHVLFMFTRFIIYIIKQNKAQRFAVFIINFYEEK